MKDLIALKQSEKIALTLRSWFADISLNTIEIISDRSRFNQKKDLIQKPKLIKLSKNIYAVYCDLSQKDENLVTAFIGKEPIKGEIILAECLKDETAPDCKDYMFEVDFVPLVKCLDNLLIPNFSKKMITIQTFPNPF